MNGIDLDTETIKLNLFFSFIILMVSSVKKYLHRRFLLILNIEGS
jgi:hypothetical protein